MGILINSTDSRSIKQLWMTLHVVATVSALIGGAIWFCTPFFTRYPRMNGYHRFFRWSSIIIGAASGSACLSSSLVLAGIEPRIKAIEKYELAQFKHAVASELYLAQQTNSAIAIAVASERKSSLGLPMLEPGNPMELEGCGDSVDVPVSDGTPGVPGTERERNDVTSAAIIALNDGIPDSEIIKNILGYTGRNYPKGKAKLEEIKKSQEQEDV